MKSHDTFRRGGGGKANAQLPTLETCGTFFKQARRIFRDGTLVHQGTDRVADGSRHNGETCLQRQAVVTKAYLLPLLLVVPCGLGGIASGAANRKSLRGLTLPRVAGKDAVNLVEMRAPCRRSAARLALPQPAWREAVPIGTAVRVGWACLSCHPIMPAPTRNARLAA